MSFLLLSSCSYLPDEDQQGSHEYIQEETGDYILIHSPDNMPTKAFLFVPGGFVDPHVYLCWMEELVVLYPEIAVIQLKVASNLAISNMGKIKKVKAHFDDIEYWAIGGHSLGGVVSVFTVFDDPEMFDGLVLIASWATESKSLKDWSGEVLSIYGSKDGLATVEEIEENKQYLPGEMVFLAENLTSLDSNESAYYEIEGGNHAGFGCYGFQDGDQVADISQEDQQEAMITIMANYFEQLWD